MNLINEFAGAGLRLEVRSAPIVMTNRDIFQMDIRRERGREWFRLWRGHETNRIHVADEDRDRRQLVLMVQEIRRTFIERISKRVSVGRPREQVLVRETPDEWIVRRETSPSLRRFLCGTDETHLFVAQFEGGTTVRDAHRLLKPRIVREAEQSGPGRILRQGEWFFVPLNSTERGILRNALDETPYIVRRREPLGGNGRPHVADEVVFFVEGARVYARGVVRHPDHRDLFLDDWRRVWRNAEVRQDTFGRNGIYWID
jgi:hypothetical protein